ncbi:MAG: ion transporter [Lysobacteraceae bacterium]|nr:MAG: ion transporter [Xanthomonadaceae bacterium]
MSDEQNGNGNGNGQASRSWLGKIGQALSGEPKDRDELVEQLREAHRNQILDADALGMIEGALDVSESQVREAMVPRGQIVCLPLSASRDEILNEIVESGHSRFPVFEDEKDKVVGILLAKDLLRFFVDGTEFDLKAILRPVVFVPESKRLNVLLSEFRASRNHMAVVIDEYGGVSGLITIEDVLEEIVGDIDDEHDEDEGEMIRRQDANRYILDALTTVDEFDDYFDSNLAEQDEAETIGGVVTKLMGRVPERGERVQLDRFNFRVLRADDRRLHQLELKLGDAAQ